MIKFHEMSDNEWEQMPPPNPPKPPNQWDEALGVLGSGKPIEIEVPEGKLKGYRIGLARSAASRGFKLEFRTEGNRMAVRRSDKSVTPKESSSTPRKPRTRKGEAEG